MFKNTFKILLYELFPSLYFKKMKYRIEGKCSNCGDCCRFIHCAGSFAMLDFKLMALLFPKYKRFKAIGKDEYGNIIVACSLIKENNLCPDYENRPRMCRNYPEKVYKGGSLHSKCTYRPVCEKDFECYLK